MNNQGNYTLFHDPEAPSLAETLRKFEDLAGETLSRKARGRAAVATLGRLLKKPASEISAQPNFLMRQFPRFKNRPTGLTPKSLSNCKSELRYLMDKVGGRSGRSCFRPLSTPWLELRNAFRDQPLLWRLSRLMAFCSALEVKPQEVDNALLEKFRIALCESAEIDKPDRKVRDTILAWNKLTTMAVDAALPTLSSPPARVARWTIEPERFPESFQNDVSCWLERLSTVDPEAEEGPIRALRPESLKLYKHQVFKAASALSFSGRSIASISSLACLVEIDAFKALLKYLRERQGGRPTTALRILAITLKSMARHQLHLGEEHLGRMGRICSNYNVEGAVSKSRERLKNFEDEKLLGAFLHLPDRLLKEASRPGTSPRTSRILAQVAIAIEIELHAPLRLSNLAALNIPGNIQSVIVGGQLRWIIRFDRHETKNRSSLTYELPAAAVRKILHAFSFYEQTDGWLFPGEKGLHKQSSLLGLQIKQTVERRLGIPFNVHLIRGLVATMQIREHDNGMEYARAMLADRSDRVIREHYTSTAEQHLIRKGQDTIQRVRLRTAPILPSRSKRSSVA
jgi:hypothetical protein